MVSRARDRSSGSWLFASRSGGLDGGIASVHRQKTFYPQRRLRRRPFVVDVRLERAALLPPRARRPPGTRALSAREGREIALCHPRVSAAPQEVRLPASTRTRRPRTVRGVGGHDAASVRGARAPTGRPPGERDYAGGRVAGPRHSCACSVECSWSRWGKLRTLRPSWPSQPSCPALRQGGRKKQKKQNK